MTVPAMHVASALEAYELWADTYPPEPHNPLMAAEQKAMLTLLPDVRGRRILDLACGTGRYSKLAAAAQAADVVALDLSPAMLRRVSTGMRVQASMSRLPLTDDCFDLAISGLAVGHAPDLDRWMHEVTRVLIPGGTLLYSDFHPAAWRRGLRRTFKDQSDREHAVAHCCHEVESQRAAATAAGLVVENLVELRAGIEFVEPFDGADAFYRREHGTPLVLVVRARKPNGADTRAQHDKSTRTERSAHAADDSVRDLSRRAVRDMDVAAGKWGHSEISGPAPDSRSDRVRKIRSVPIFRTASRRGRCRAESRPQSAGAPGFES